ncbi:MULTISPECIES: hypothetical protein [Streptomyces]|uniref:hypothetical protein n=1 Tax=Streptomyces TaxID=1883 RepID=UPI00163C801A|nr:MULTISPECIES: hypothetical protein [Streptomyces]MBC2873620.1 hypothetical protein [Streptomyces sp. TYQ1024]UBI37945.1 hypothetical protein K7I03_16680 [Streptomyces mobaraensis]UKW30531.1 hypothetical protein MCU78_16645 [Streptomyces sp. TYQ1024]
MAKRGNAPPAALERAPAVPHTSGPPMYPTRDECGICGRYRSAVNGAMGRAQWARVQGFQDEADAVRREAADYLKGGGNTSRRSRTGRRDGSGFRAAAETWWIADIPLDRRAAPVAHR